MLSFVDDRFYNPVRVDIVAEKRRTGERVEGWFMYDGLASLWPVETEDGVRYVSDLDTIIKWKEQR